MFDAVAMRAPDVMVYGNHFDLGMLLWAFARLGYNGSAACQLLEQVSTFGQPVLYTGDLIAISHVLWAFAKIGPSTRSTQVGSCTLSLGSVHHPCVPLPAVCAAASRVMPLPSVCAAASCFGRRKAARRRSGARSQFQFVHRAAVTSRVQVDCFLDWLHMVTVFRLDLDRDGPEETAAILWALATLRKQGYQNDATVSFLADLAEPLQGFLLKCKHQEVRFRGAFLCLALRTLPCMHGKVQALCTRLTAGGPIAAGEHSVGVCDSGRVSSAGGAAARRLWPCRARQRRLLAAGRGSDDRMDLRQLVRVLPAGIAALWQRRRRGSERVAARGRHHRAGHDGMGPRAPQLSARCV